MQGKMIPRLLKKDVEDGLRLEAAVALIGPRQVGKTTLALEIAKERDALYLDLEDPIDRGKLDNPVLFFESHEDQLIILDEIHRAPEIFQILRGVIDKGRRRQKGKGRFLILGSASIDLLRQSGESLAGRIAYIDMVPFTVLEIGDSFAERERLWLRGGFPGSYLADSDQDSQKRRRHFIRTYLERDIPMFGPRVPSETLERLWTMLAHNQGTLLNTSHLARALAISTQSATRYIDLLVDLFLVRRLKPYHANVSKRLVKSPKVYVRDSGLLHNLLDIESLDRLAGHPVVGESWEGFVIENLLSVLPWNHRPFFYRTAAGAEIDLVIEKPNGKLWAIEIKRSPASKPTKGFHNALEDLSPERSFIVHGGEDRWRISETQESISLRKMALELQNLGSQ